MVHADLRESTPSIPPVRRLHFAVVGFLFVASASAPMLRARMVTPELFTGLHGVHQAILLRPEVAQVSFRVGERYTTGVGSMDYAHVRIRLNRPVADHEGLAKRVSDLLLANYSSAKTKDVIAVSLAYGYDMGIASAWKSNSHAFDPATGEKR